MKRCQWGQRALTDSGVATGAGGEVMAAADSGEHGGDGGMPMGADVSSKGWQGWQRSTWVAEVNIAARADSRVMGTDGKMMAGADSRVAAGQRAWEVRVEERGEGSGKGAEGEGESRWSWQG